MPVKPHIIDPEGDIFLHLARASDDSEDLVRVSSRVLCLASPVFRTILGPNSNFQEAQTLRDNTDTPNMIRLLDDDASAMLMLLKVVHLPTHLLPRQITLDVFYEIAIVCDKYDMARVMVSWAMAWISATESVDDAQWLAIAWVFRDRPLFNRVTKWLIMYTRLDEYNNLVLHGNQIYDALVPGSVVDEIGKARSRIIVELSQFALATLSKYATAASSGLNLCRAPPNHDPTPSAVCPKGLACDRSEAGLLLLSFGEMGLFPTEPERNDRSLMEIMKGIARIRSYRSGTGSNMEIGHRACCILNEVTSAVVDLIYGCEGLMLSDFMAETLIFFPEEQ